MKQLTGLPEISKEMAGINPLIKYKFPPTASRKLRKRSRKYFQHRKDSNSYRRTFNGKRFFDIQMDEILTWSEPQVQTVRNSIGETLEITIIENSHFKHP